MDRKTGLPSDARPEGRQTPVPLSPAGGVAAPWWAPGLLGLLWLALGLRVLGLADQSFWWDEAFSAVTARQGPRAILGTVTTADFHPPLHYLLLWAWGNIAGSSEFALRYLSVMASLLAVALAAAAGRSWLGPVGGLLSALVMAVAPFQVYYAQEARMYALAALWTTGLLAVAARLGVRPTPGRALAYAAFGLLGLYTFYYCLLPLAILGLLLTLQCLRTAPRRPRLATLLLAHGLLALGYLPWLPVLLRATGVWDSPWTPPTTPLKVLTWSGPALALGLPDPTLVTRPPTVYLLGSLGLVLLLGLASSLAQPASRAAWLPALVAAGALGLMVAIATVRPIFHPRYTLPASPPLLLALAGAVLALGRAWRPAGGVALLVVLSSCLYGLVVLRTDPAYRRDDYRGALAFAEAHWQPGDIVLTNAEPPVRYYLGDRRPFRYLLFSPYGESTVVETLNTIATHHRRAWLVWQPTIPTDPEDYVGGLLAQNAQRLDDRWFGAVHLQLYALPGPHFQPSQAQPVDLNFANQVRLVRVGLSRPAVPAGERLDVILTWEVLAPPPTDYGVSVLLTDAQGHILSRADRQPRNQAMRLSSGWRPGDRLESRHPLPVPAGTPPGRYRLGVVVYALADLRGLDLLVNGVPQGQQGTIGTLTVQKGRPGAQPETEWPETPPVVLDPTLRLARYRVETPTVAAGAPLRLRLLWQALGSPVTTRPVLFELVGDGDETLARLEHRPLADSYPVDRWEPGELVLELLDWPLPPTLVSGTARLRLRLSGAPAEAAQDLGMVTIQSRERRFTVPAIRTPLVVPFEDGIVLLGYDLEPRTARPDQPLTLTLYWQARTTPARNYTVFTHLLDQAERIHGQHDGPPDHGRAPTAGWLPGEVIADQHVLTVQATAPPGDYVLEIGLYLAESGQRLRRLDTGEDRVILTTVRVHARPE